MALRAGYYGLKRFERNKLLDLAVSIPADIGPDNPIASKSDISATVDLLKDTTGWLGGNELPSDIVNLGTSGSGVVEKTLATDANAIAFVGEIKSNTDYVVKAEGGNRFRVALATVKPANGTAVNIIYDNASVRNHSFNSGAYNYIYLLADYQGTGTLETIKPMLLTEEQYKLNPAYRPYHGTVDEVKADKTEVQTSISLLDDTVGWVGKNKMNAKFKNSEAPNIVVTPHYGANGLLEYVNLNGNNPDGEKILIQFAARLDGDLILPNGNYKFSIGVSNENIKLQVGRNSSGPTSGSFVLLATSSYGDSDLSFTQDQPYGLTVQIFAKANSTFDNVKVYPMVCTTEQYALNPSYRPYHESVEEMLATKDVTVTAGTDVTVNANTHVYSKTGIVSGSMCLEIGGTLTAGATIATLGVKPKGTTYAIAIDNTDASVIPIIIDTNGAVQLFASFVPTEGHQLLIPISFIDDPGAVTNREISAKIEPEYKYQAKKNNQKKVIKEEED